MKKNMGIAILLFAILLRLCSAGMDWFALAVGAIGLIISVFDGVKKD